MTSFVRRNFSTRFIISFLLLIFTSSVIYTKKDNFSEIESEIQQDLDSVLGDLISEKLYVDRNLKNYNKTIKSKVRREVRRQIFRESKKNIKNKIYQKNPKLDIFQDKVCLYKLPTWPFYSWAYLRNAVVQIDASFDFANQSYSSNGDIQDLSNLVFQQEDMKLKDVLLVSRLLKDRTLYSLHPSYRGLDVLYFYLLADQGLVFDAQQSTQKLSINYARHIHKGDVSFGFQFPFVRRQNELKLSSGISESKRDELQDASDRTVAGYGPSFIDQQGSLDNFIGNILSQKGISYNKKDFEIGIGDVSLFLNVEFDWHACERLVAGMNFLFAMAKDRDTDKLWDPELGNGGFNKIEAFGSIMFSENRFFNPHFFTKVSFTLPATVKRRIPKIITYDGDVNTAVSSSDILYGSYTQYATKITGTNSLDSNVRRFANSAQKIKIKPSPEFFFRMGNTFERFLAKRAFLDIFYDLRFKGKDYIGFWLNLDEYNPSVLTDNSWQIEHRLGLTYDYLIDEHFRFKLGGLYTFAGRNVPRTLQANVSLNIEF